MTVLCGGNASQPIPGTTLLQNMTAAAIVDFLTSLDISWFAILAYGVGYLAYDLTGLCTTDPPPLPDFTPDRVFGYTNPANPQGAQWLREDTIALVGHYLWFQYCQCVGTATPAPPPPPAQPPGQQTNNPAIGGPTPGDCGFGPSLFAALVLDADGNGDSAMLSNDPFTAAVQWLELDWNAGTTEGTGNAPVPFDYDVTLRTMPASSSGVLSFSVPANTPTTQTSQHQMPIPLGTTNLHVYVHAQQSGGQFAVDLNTRFYCTTTPPGALQPCCPPDPLLEQLLVQIQLELQELLARGGAAPPAYTQGTRHAGRSGTGSLPVAGLFGFLIQVTSGVPTTPELPGVPPYQWSVGWISVLTGDGMIDEIRLTRQAQIWAPALAPLATVFGYQLNPGFTADITELLPA